MAKHLAKAAWVDPYAVAHGAQEYMRKHGISTQYNVKCPVLPGPRDSDKKHPEGFFYWVHPVLWMESKIENMTGTTDDWSNINAIPSRERSHIPSKIMFESMIFRTSQGGIC